MYLKRKKSAVIQKRRTLGSIIIVRMLWDYLKPNRKIMLWGLLMKITGTLSELLLPMLLSVIIDDVVPTGDMKKVLLYGLAMMLCALSAWIFNVRANRNASLSARNTTEAIRHDLFEKIMVLSSEDTDRFTIASLESRLTSDTCNVHRMIGMMQRMGIRGPIIIIGGLFLCFLMEPVLALVLLGTMPFIGVLLYIRAVQGVPLYASVQAINDRMVRIVRENYRGIRVIKALGKTDHERDRFASVSEELSNRNIYVQRKMAIIRPGMDLLMNAGLVAVIFVGALRVSKGLSHTGAIIAFMSYFTIISGSMMMVSRIFVMLSQGLASFGRIEEVLKTPGEKDWKIEEHPSGDPENALEFIDVSFSYLGVRNNAEDISFALKKGESLGIIGETGSGKTTLLSLLLRFYHPQEGAIYVNGKDVRDYEPSALRSLFGVAMQNDFLFRESIRENIDFGREVTAEEREKAIAVSQAKEFIDSLEGREDFLLEGKGSNLSGGQRQRLVLARAFAGTPDFLLLDDSSSALDYQTDARLRQAISKEYPDSTRIIIAQRISSIMNCSKIMILEEGRIRAIGTHEELMKDELYSSIYESQMGGALFD